MSHKPYKGFEPKWVDTPAPADSYRSIFRWGDPEFFKYPKESLYKMMKEVFKLTDDDFKEYTDDIGFDKVDLSDHPVKLAQEHIDALREIVGDEGISTSDYDRLSVAYGFTAYDILRLRHKVIDSVPDVVLYPDTTEQVEKIVAYSTEHDIPLYVYGGGSSVTRGVEPVKGGISLDMRRRFNKVISFNEIDQTITVQAGMSGPDLEKTLQNAPELFGAKRQYTCGHFRSRLSTPPSAAGRSREAQVRTAPTTAALPISCCRRSMPPPSALSRPATTAARPVAPTSIRS